MIKNRSIVLYGLIGLINTIVSYIIIFILIYITILPEVSNFIGYVIGVIGSYFLNKKVTFKNKLSHKKVFPKFIFALSIAYVINLLIMSFSFRVLNVNVYISQIIGGIFYTLIGYSLSSYWVFKDEN